MSHQRLWLCTPKVATKFSPNEDTKRREPEVPLPPADGVPGASVGKVPNCLFSEMEERVWVRLEDADSDVVRHATASTR
jgi:hypothetical protein